ncbi:hypothetical protein KKH23_01650 [Patescibacteria group bacterium]|nr:hypothetical protein [Patescibacteria group bacterium]MBU0777192.1 hypothetical protein [Patescibacteria group bacterium]MBU0845887.1 hypothetical protein [Patescibacteria group bacterium]MBU0922914.1 hypothetical protein [Patescibacteria group bacterium]MBU1066353.1 hypothetical protein [Patescibacteria group bacterium]
MNKESEQPEIRVGGRVLNIVVEGELERVVLYLGEKLAGEDEEGVKLEITREGRMFTWRFFDEEKDKWSYWLNTYHAPTERVNENDLESPTIALVAKECGFLNKRLPYSEQWRRYGEQGRNSR